MGWDQRSRIANLRDAPLNGREHNGHDLALPQVVQWSPANTAVMILDSVLPGKPMPIHVGHGVQPVMGAMPNWTEVAANASAEIAKRHADPLAWTAGERHEVNLLNAMAAFQRVAMSLAEAAAGMRGPGVVTPDEPLPEAPEEGSTRRPEPPGYDANGSPSE